MNPETTPPPDPAAAALPTPAWIEIEGVVNMRDVGGLPTDDGGTIATGRLIRSDNLQDLPAASVAHLLEDVGVTDVVDLRTYVEVAKEGDGPLIARPEVTVHHLTLYPEETAETGIPAGERELPWHRDPDLGDTAATDRADRTGQTHRPVRIEARDDREGPERHDSYWSQHYLGYLAKRPDHVVAALRAVAQAPGAVVVHCAAGKDRTGTVVGLALKLAGATDEAVVADFAASAERVPQILARLANRPAYSTNLDGKTVQQQSPRAETMRMMLETLEREHGGVEGWLATQGWTPKETAQLRAKLRG